MEKHRLSVTSLILVFVLFSLGLAQFRSDSKAPKISQILSMPQNTGNGFFDPNRMQMHHSFSMSYSSFMGQGLMLNTYMNSIDYRFSEKLLLRTNIGLVSSPYNTFGEGFFLNRPKLFGGAELQYRMTPKSQLSLRVETMPYFYYSGWRPLSPFEDER